MRDVVGLHLRVVGGLVSGGAGAEIKFDMYIVEVSYPNLIYLQNYHIQHGGSGEHLFALLSWVSKEC